MRIFCPWNSPGNKHSGPSKPNILRPYLPSAGPLDWESWCVYWIPQSLWRTSLFNYNSSYFWNIGLDYTTSLPLLPISVWFLLYIFSHRFFFWVISVFMNKWSKWSHSVMSDSLRPHWLWPTRLLHPWDFPGKSTGVGCHFFLQYCLTGRKDFSVFRDSGDDSEKVQVQRKWCKFLMRQFIPGKTKNWIREELVVVARDWGVGKTGSYWSMSKMSKS